MNLAIQRNLPIFKKGQIIPHNGKFYTSAKIGSETYLGFMNIIPRNDHFAFIDSYNSRVGQFRIGRLDTMLVNRSKKSEILIEVVPNRRDGRSDFKEFIPKINAGFLSFITDEVNISFVDWIRFVNEDL